MQILLRDTDLNGQPIVGSGMLIQGDTPLAIVARMQSTSPFNEREPVAYMRHILESAAADTDLPGSADSAALIFLERLAHCGFAEFIREEPPEQLEAAVIAIRDTGRTNMLDASTVTNIAREFQFDAVAEWIEAHPAEYISRLLAGTFHDPEPKGDTPCADKQDL